MKWFSIFFALFTGAAFAKMTIHDYVTPFIDGYKPSSSLNTNRAHILKYEYRYASELAASFYSNNSVVTRERALEKLDEYAKRLPDLVKLYPVKLKEVRLTLDVVRDRFRSIFNQELDAEVFLYSELLGTDARAMGPMPNSFSLNLRVISGYSKDEIEIVIAHELFHLVQDQMQAKEPQPGLMDAGLFSEGWATFASSLVYPGKPDWKYISYFEADDSQFKLFEKYKRDIIESMLKDWDSKDSKVLKKYFSGDARDSKPWPPRSGYFIGYLAAKKLAESRGKKSTALMKYHEFRGTIKNVLKQLALQ